MNEDLKVGDTLYLPAGQYRPERFKRIEKVGRKWLHLSSGKVSKKDLLSDCIFGSPTQYYRSKEDWEEESSHLLAWQRFRLKVDAARMRPPAPKEDIEKAASILGINLYD